jgi:hypothetical protein
MGYRGEDLDLRTPHAVAADPAALAPTDPFGAGPRLRVPGHGASRPPIWVDDAALECCNHAFEVAVVHRAGEVRLEHLVFALTLTGPGAEALEARGIRVATLRRDAATLIAEIPATLASAKAVPRRSEAFEEALRLAASIAYRRQEPVGAPDIVGVLLDGGIDLSGSLQRLLPVAPRLQAPPSEAPRVYAADLVGPATASQNFGQNSRIDALEQSIRTLTAELTSERKIISGVLQDLQRELMAQREDTLRLGGQTQDKIQAVFGDRLQSLEQTFLSARSPAGDLAALQDRLSLLERALQAEISVTRSAVEALAARPAVDLAPLAERLDAIEAAAAEERERAKIAEQTLSESIAALAARLESQPAEIGTLITGPLGDRLDVLSGAEDTRHATLSEGLGETHRRLGALQEALTGHAARTSDAERAAQESRDLIRQQIDSLAAAVRESAATSKSDYTTLTDNLTEDLGELHDGITQIRSDHSTLAANLVAESQDVASAFAALASRIESLERESQKPIEMLTALSGTVDKMHKVTVERYYRRNRFWYWLFGTDDWLAASWPSQSARIAAELRAIKQ